MKGKDIGHVSVKVPKILQLRSIYNDENAMSYFSNTGVKLRSRVNGGSQRIVYRASMFRFWPQCFA